MALSYKNGPKLAIPYDPTMDDKGHFDIVTIQERYVCEYTGLSIKEVMRLNVVDFWMLLRDAVIYRCIQTKEGQEHLDNCWRLQQTKADRAALQKKFGKN